MEEKVNKKSSTEAEEVVMDAMEKELDSVVSEEDNEEELGREGAENEDDGEVEVEVERTGAISYEELKGNHVRLMAEFDNFRKRVRKEQADMVRYASQNIMKALLPVLDNFERSLEVMGKTDNVASVKEGVALVYDNMFKIFEKQGLKRIECKGEEFDSNLHEAVTTIAAGEDLVGKVVDEIEAGYMLHEHVVRYAKVVVGE